MSTGSFSSQNTRSFLSLFLQQHFGIALSAEAVRAVSLAIRKSAHVFEYGLLTVFLWNAVSASGGRTFHARMAIGCVLAVAAYAIGDEFHQSLVPGREASAMDVAFDTAGALLACTWMQVRRGSSPCSRGVA